MSSLRHRFILPGRWMAPLLLGVFALLSVGVNYALQTRELDAQVQQQETRRLQERLGVEQTRLSVQSGADNAQLVRRLVGGLGVYGGMLEAFLVGPDGTVQASLGRSDIGLSLAEVLAGRSGLQGLNDLPPAGPGEMAIAVQRLPGSDLLAGMVPLVSGRRLIVAVDMAYPLAQRRLALRTEALREGALLLVLAAFMALLMHVVWFRRANQLMQALSRMGDGQLQTRTGLFGRDELARIGAEADRMAERLQAQQSQLRHMADLVDRSPLVVVEWRNLPGWPMSYLSRSVAQWGYQPESLLDGSVAFADLIHPDDQARVHAEVEHYLAHGPDEYRQEYRLRCDDGRWVWVDDRTSLTRDTHGEVVGISGILLDITVQKEAQLAQYEQAEMLRLFYELPFLGMAISAPDDKRWLQVNDRLCEILGYTREELLVRTWTEMTPQPDLDRNLLLLEQVKAGQRDGYQMHKRFVRKDGRLVDTEIEVRAVRHADGTLHRLFATVQDVTERLQASEALRQQKNLLEQAEAMAGLGSWSYDGSTGAVWWSDQMYRNIGRDPQLGPPPAPGAYLDCIHPDDRSRVAAFVRAAASEPELRSLEFRRHPELGPERWFRGSVQSLGSTTGQGLRLSGTLLDITRLKQAQMALEHSNAELEQRVQERTAQLSVVNRELEAFTYTVSHDLKAPLRGIDGYSQLLDEEYAAELGEDGRSFVARIRRGVSQMSALIADLLDYSRMERRAMDMQPLALQPLVRRVLDEFSADIERSGAQVTLELDPLVLRLDREGLAVALRNLVGNALKFNRPGHAPELVIGASQRGDHHLLWVKDHGVGFDMKYHDRIFGIFQRLQRSEDYAGTGVGLALVAKAVQRMGGRVWAESQPGQGATFYMEFSA